jgi:uncharacterized protein
MRKRNKKYVLVTGANGAIGMALAHKFASEGYNLVLLVRDKKQASVPPELSVWGVDVRYVCVDLNDPGAALRIKEQTDSQRIKVTHLINNAGFGELSRFEDTDMDKLVGMIDVNIRSLVSLTKVFLPDIIECSGGVLHVGSVAGFMPGPNKSVYFASKAFVVNFSIALRQELAGRATVSVLCPGPTKGGFWFSSPANSKLNISQINYMSADKVARIGYDGYMAGKAIITPGLLNKCNTLAPRFFSKVVMARIVAGLFVRPKD